jgi:hypothetical protein
MKQSTGMTTDEALVIMHLDSLDSFNFFDHDGAVALAARLA